MVHREANKEIDWSMYCQTFGFLKPITRPWRGKDTEGTVLEDLKHSGAGEVL